MFLSAKKTQKISVTEEVDKLKEYFPGHFLKAKKTIDVNSEIEFLNKKFEKRFLTPLKPIIKPESEQTTVKACKVLLGKQYKIVNSFNIQKPVISKGERVLF
jgi:hypothetical protein